MSVQDLVIQDLRENKAAHGVADDQERRKAIGLAKYGKLLHPFNGRDALRDAYEEALDLQNYLRQAIEEGRDVVALYEAALDTAIAIRRLREP